MDCKRFASSELGDTTCHAKALLAYYEAGSPTTAVCDFDWTSTICCNLNCRWLLQATTTSANDAVMLIHLFQLDDVRRRVGCGSLAGLWSRRTGDAKSILRAPCPTLWYIFRELRSQILPDDAHHRFAGLPSFESSCFAGFCDGIKI